MMKSIMSKQQHDRLSKMEVLMGGGPTPSSHASDSSSSAFTFTSTVYTGSDSTNATSLAIPSQPYIPASVRTLTLESELTMELDPLDISDLLEQDQTRHRLEIKLLDDQFSALSNNIRVKDK
jgi:hypothetical protein